mmetsp:Transcript_14423/g.34045  ORF Transcript_14423/g.34045 Transcript_14423/m.34045 type:complete len:117 (-) Transcript_14423:1451-1801(-)
MARRVVPSVLSVFIPPISGNHLVICVIPDDMLEVKGEAHAGSAILVAHRPEGKLSVIGVLWGHSQQNGACLLVNCAAVDASQEQRDWMTAQIVELENLQQRMGYLSVLCVHPADLT